MAATLYLHCGYHRTGSSYLQTVLASGRQPLASAGFYYPTSATDAAALGGLPTAGNGSAVAMAIRRRDDDASRAALGEYQEEAASRGCDAVVLSSEDYFHSFGVDGAMACLERAAKAVGFTGVRGFVFFRDPAAHAVSTYIHRAMRGPIADFKAWLVTGYETPRLHQAFHRALEATGIRWLVRKYEPSVRDVAEVAFSDWLGIHERPDAPWTLVNPSTTLSEALLIRTLEAHNPGSGRFVHDALTHVPPQTKARDTSLKDRYERLAYAAVAQRMELYEFANTLLPASEQLTLRPPVWNERRRASDEEALTITLAQSAAISTGLELYRRSVGPVPKFRRLMGRALRTIHGNAA